MNTESENQETFVYHPQGYIPADHPWLEMDATVDEEIRYSLDEIRVG